MLNPALLQANLLKVLKDKENKTPDKAAKQLAKAYDDYAKMAMALGTVPTFTGTEVLKLEGLLLPAIATPAAGLPPIIASAWATGVMSYWFLPPVPFAGAGQAGAVLQSATVVPIIIPGLTACFSNPLNTEELCASIMASVLDSATRTVMVTLAPPPGTVAPLI